MTVYLLKVGAQWAASEKVTAGVECLFWWEWDRDNLGFRKVGPGEKKAVSSFRFPSHFPQIESQHQKNPFSPRTNSPSTVKPPRNTPFKRECCRASSVRVQVDNKSPAIVCCQWGRVHPATC